MVTRGFLPAVGSTEVMLPLPFVDVGLWCHGHRLAALTLCMHLAQGSDA